MSSENDQDRQRDVRQHIAEVLRTYENAAKKKLPAAELQTLKAAAGRLDQLLANAADAEVEALRTAADRLDQMLKDLGKGKDVAHRVKLRHPNNQPPE
jgi:hypothetical protein